jgi:hypothetical protein
MRPLTRLLMPLLAVLLIGCATNAVEKNYGSATSNMVREQTYDVSTRTSVGGDKPVLGMDPYWAAAALDCMRKDLPDRESAQKSAQSAVTVTQTSGSTSSSGSNAGCSYPLYGSGLQP